MKLFPRIFLSFWIATVLMIGFVLSISELLPARFPGDRDKRFEPELAIPALTAAVNVYEQKGAAAFHSQIRSVPMLRHRSLRLFDEQGNPLVAGQGDSSFGALMAKDVSQSGHSQFVHLGLRMFYACPLQSATGRHYAVVLTIAEPVDRLLNPRFWFNLIIAMFPAGLVCMALALYLTRPISKLQTAARRLAAGELDARAGPLRFVRRDELGDLARDFDRMAAQIQLLMTAQRRFVADVSHELGGPLTRMHLALALLRREFAGTKSGALVRIERETDKLSNLVQQLLLLAGLEAGRIPAEVFAPVSIRSLCESIIEDANFEAAHANCQVIGSRQDITVLVYPNLLRRAIDNVLRNAIRYAPANTQIELSCNVDLIQREVTIDVLDCGPGVPDAMLADIFTPFFRTAPGRETSSGGTGLGLAIASEAVRLHEGTITARNRKTGGLQVTITFPLRTPLPEDTYEPNAEIGVQDGQSI
jgi:two-component system, OmpR family, sensor histidine kinase CpxA